MQCKKSQNKDTKQKTFINKKQVKKKRQKAEGNKFLNLLCVSELPK